MVAMSTVWDARKIAEYFIWKSQQENKPVTNKKLQKLLYYAQAWNLTLNSGKLFKQNIEAWVHGPAVREVYLEYKEFGFEPITKTIDAKSFSFPEEQQEIMDQVWKVYGKFDANYLELLSHSEKPWIDARAGLEPDEGSTNIIDPDSIVNFYSARLKEAEKQ